ncbi:helix-turn-helix transcriptional regulator [Granulicella sibirica]|uniref:Transcriptional regulatory protein n=1 Tax=Granulicella sibirica TaxID=2479048 RepID=A0A4Q0T0K0_9BACT|nr:hypothetical protein [Granulicella sibirica]RXH55860.1 Transcriptional regulatory protein [Granulicella sibirica]
MHSPAKVSHLLRLLHEAAAEPQHWTAFIEAMVQETSAACSFVIALPEDHHPPLYHQFGFEDPVLRSYNEHFVHEDLILDRFRQAGNLHGSWIGNRQSLLPDAELEASSFYNDYMRPMNLYHQAGANVGRVANYSLAGMTLVRPRSLGEFDARTTSLLRLIAPHLKQAFQLHHKLSQLNLGNSLLEQGLETTGVACVTIDSRGTVQSQTAAAEKLISQSDGLCLTQGRLQAVNPKEDRLLESILFSALKTTSNGIDSGHAAIGGEIRISRRPPRKPLHLVVTPFRSGIEILQSHPSALVFLVDPESRTPPRGALLRRLFGLTPSEAKLAELLAEGHDVKCCAERMRITEASARFVLKRVFQKTSVKSQSSLMRLTLSLPCLPEERAALR